MIKLRYNIAEIVFNVFILLFFSTVAHARSNHDMQDCSPIIIEKVLQIINIKQEVHVSNDSQTYEEHAQVAKSACKTTPFNKKIIIATVAYGKNSDDKVFLIALINNKTHQIVASYKGEIIEDAGMDIETGGIWIDTAPYTLAKNSRAFGLEITSGYMPNCGDGGLNTAKTLYIQEGNRIRPILEHLDVSSWSYIQEGQSRCTGPDAPEETIIENFKTTISVLKTQSHGYNDLLITTNSTRDDGKKSTRLPFHFKLSYDGKQYPLEKMGNAYWQWRP